MDMSTEECYLFAATERGVEAACERLPLAEQAACFLIAPMMINGGADYDASYCDALRGNYFPGDVQRTRDQCLQTINLMQRFNDMDTAEEQEAFVAELQAEIAHMEAEFERGLDE